MYRPEDYGYAQTRRTVQSDEDAREIGEGENGHDYRSGEGTHSPAKDADGVDAKEDDYAGGESYY